ncbi:D-xylose-proton symporter-like 2 [Hibiscus syriacus]|uniref:D-xylose-proton symporter-like 2 n=1 Tax=Hibiscus syriacus TaxID=106335 RepID=A0A6A2ZQW2_HIBSY|nr:protein SMG9-like isoform X2 [Hibiscus syriacus]KAE8694431.1 D-xylose-proton symporter-like 2 [Hibiscus syriacus]
MAGSTSGTNPSLNPSAPKILLAKPSVGPVSGKFGRGAGEDETVPHRARLPPVGSLNLLSDSWEFHIDRFLPFLTENTDFKVVGIIGPPGVGKSTIMNELYGFDGISPGMLPPFAIQSEETRAMARHCTVGIEPRISAERLILLDTQSVFSPSVLSEIMRPDGSSTVSVLSGESLSAELAHEIMNIQLGVLLASICHILLVVSDGVHDNRMWHMMLTVDLLKHGIPDPSSLVPLHSQSSTSGPDKESKDKVHETEEYIGTPVFVHTRLQNQDLSPSNILQMKKALLQYFSSSSFMRRTCGKKPADQLAMSQINGKDKELLNLFVIPCKNNDDSTRAQCESYVYSLWKLRDQVLSMSCPSFTRNVSERDWLKSSAKIWELVKSSPIIGEYSRTLLSSGIFRR